MTSPTTPDDQRATAGGETLKRFLRGVKTPPALTSREQMLRAALPEIRRLRIAGYTYVQIVELLQQGGVTGSVTTIKRALRRLGLLPADRKKKTPIATAGQTPPPSSDQRPKYVSTRTLERRGDIS